MRIEDLIRSIGEGKVLITDHADEEAEADVLSFDEVYFSVVHGEIIEEYPADRPYPSCLVYGDTFGGDPVHSVWAHNEANGFGVIITVYRPDPTRRGGSRTGRPGEDRVALERRFKEAFEACPVCGGELVEKRVEKLLRGGTDTARLQVDALVCRRCGERLYPEETVRRFEKIRGKLSREETDDLTLVGSSYEAPDD